MSMPQQPTVFKTCFCRKFSPMYAEIECCVQPGMRPQYIVCCWTVRPSSFQKLWTPPPIYATGPNFQVKYVPGSTLFQLEEVVQPYFAVKYGGPYLLTNFWGSIITMTGSRDLHLAGVQYAQYFQNDVQLSNTDAYRAQDRKIHTMTAIIIIHGDRRKTWTHMHVLCIPGTTIPTRSILNSSLASRFHCSSSRSIALLTLVCSLASMSGEQQLNAIAPSTFYLQLAFTINTRERKTSWFSAPT